MTVAVFFGCTFIAFGPAFALFVFTIAKDPLRVIILIAGAFFWLLSLLLSSLVWFIALKASNEKDTELQKSLIIFGVMFSVLLQEVFRFAYYKLLRKANEGLAALSEDGKSPLSVQQMAYAFMTMAIILLHTFWSVLFFDGFENKRWVAVVAVIATHLLVSGLTFLNPVYEGSLIPAYVIMVLMAAWAYFTAGGSLQNLQHFFMCKKTNSIATGWLLMETNTTNPGCDCARNCRVLEY
ncbi:gamma-secretase subunit Aph-1b isoform X3 [Scyliorhinus canicula]|uniref:gamma-secretase subunit Aph-1b isoform X3 n=1 Tax=Scyliorhinus canicula TaxID=7830 RepID=UPI0018F4A0A7|nr:gamma-secretase subunit Aph-1b isoform X3 [Scyliorhinus canicula]